MKKQFNTSIKSFIRIISFACVLSLTITFLSYLSKPAKVDKLNISGLYSEKNKIDVIYVGGSASFVYYEPLRAWEKYGIISYDYGSNTVQIEAYKTMIQEILKNQNPDLMIIDARAIQYREDPNSPDNNPSEKAYRNFLNGMRLSKNKVEFIDKYITDDIDENGKLSYYFDIIKYHGKELNKYNLKDSIGLTFNTYDNKNKGFYFVEKHMSLKQKKFMTDEEQELPEKTKELLIELLDYLKESNINCMFVVSPYVEEESHKKIYNSAEKIIKEYGYDFIDFNENTKDMQLDYSTDFYNINHVNIFGADKYTDYLSEYIMNNKDVKSHKEDEKYQYWNNYLDEWNEKVNKAKNTISEIIKENNE